MAELFAWTSNSACHLLACLRDLMRLRQLLSCCYPLAFYLFAKKGVHPKLCYPSLLAVAS